MGFKRTYRKTFGHKSPYRRTFGSRNAGQAIGVSYRTMRGVAQDVAKIKRDLDSVKSRQNNEKKYKDADIETTTCGQVSHDSDGIKVFDITPAISQGTDSDERVGNSIKLTGMSIPIQFAQQVNTLGDRKVKISLLRVRAADNGVSTSESANLVWDVNPLTSVRDYSAPRAYRSSKNDGVSVLRTMTCYVKGPTLETGSNGSITNREMNVKDVKFNLKLQDILRFASSGNQNPEGVRYHLVIQCDAGNLSGSGSSLDVPITDASSGLQVRVAQRNWWIDN